MGILDKFDLPFTKKSKMSSGSKREPKEYVSKIKTKKDGTKNSTQQTKGVIQKFVGRYISVIRSDINVLASIWKPRVIVVRENDITDLFE